MLRRRVQFGRTSHDFPVPESTKFVPRLFGKTLFPTPNTAAGRAVLHDLEWMLQKDILGQDMCLIGAPGPYRRRLVSHYCELTQRELDAVVLSQDTSEPDLKQRRDLRDGFVVLTPQAPLRAAVLGRVLLLDGIEKAERNVLPTLNNLLENREMNLLHGQRLVGPTHTLSAEAAAEIANATDPFSPKILKASAAFRCVALQLPVPTFPGQPIDPPLRSRFQGRICGGPVFVGAKAAPASPGSTSPGPTSGASATADSMSRPELPYLEALDMLRSYNMDRSQELVEAYLDAVLWMQSIRDGKCSSNVPLPPFEALLRQPLPPTVVMPPTGASAEERAATLTAVAAQYPVGHVGVISNRDREAFEGMPLHGAAVTFGDDGELAIRNALRLNGDARRHFAIIGARGCGKSSALRRALAAQEDTTAAAAAATRVMTCYRDMSTRDLFQRRVIDDKGDSTWVNSPLVTAALEGAPVVLDGVHRCVPSVLAALAPLIHDGELSLLSGERFMSAERFEALVDDEVKRTHETRDAVRARLNDVDRIFPVKPGFRIIGVAEDGSFTHPWLTTESMSLFPGGFITFRQPTIAESLAAVTLPSGVSQGAIVDVVTKVAEALREAGLELSLRLAQSLGQELAAMRAESSTAAIVTSYLRRALLLPFRPSTLRDAVHEALAKRELFADLGAADRKAALHAAESWTPQVQALNQSKGDVVAVWGSALDATHTFRVGASGPPLAINNRVTRPELVPHVPQFHLLPSQMRLLQAVTSDMCRGQRSILFIGNQGTGKNKLCDMLLSRLRLEREYFQLHRDTSVQSLTLTPSVQGRRLSWELSPLILAAIEGRVAVIDEADKAPLEVVVLLKALLSDEHLSLLDGRTLRRRYAHESAAAPPPHGVIFIHDGFRAIVLANRPGYPFLGNDFFRECGDIFASHIIDNPDAESSLHLMESFAPAVPRAVLSRVASAFDGLRKRHEDGELSYPFSAREMVAVAKHLQAFPRASIAAALGNITHFDQFNAPTKKIIDEVLEEHGLVLNDKPQVALGATSNVSKFDASTNRPFFAALTPTATIELDALRITRDRIKPRNISNEIEQPWRNHTQNLPKFIPPRTFSFTELVASGSLPYAGTSYSKRPVQVVGLQNCRRADTSGGDSAASARAGYLVVGSPTSLFVVDEDLTRVLEIDAVFAGGPLTAATRVHGTDWVILMGEASASVFAMHVGSCQLRKYIVPAEVYADRPPDVPLVNRPPVLHRLGHRFMNAEEVLTTFVDASSGAVAVLNRSTGAIAVMDLSPVDGSASATKPYDGYHTYLASVDLLRDPLDQLRDEQWDVSGATRPLSLLVDAKENALASVTLEWSVAHVTSPSRQLHLRCIITQGKASLEYREAAAPETVLVSGKPVPQWSIALTSGAAAPTLTLHVSKCETAADEPGSGEHFAVPLPNGVVPAGHRVVCFAPASSEASHSACVPFAVSPIAAEASNGGGGFYFGVVTVRFDDLVNEAPPSHVSVRRVSLGPLHPSILAVGHDNSLSRMMTADASGGLSVFEMSAASLSNSLQEWRAQLSRSASNASPGTADDGSPSGASDQIVTVQVLDGTPQEITVTWQAPSLVMGDALAPGQPQANDGDNAASTSAGSGSGIGSGAGGGMGGGSGGDGQGGSGSGGQGDDKQSDGLGGYSFDAQGEAIISNRRRRQTSNLVKQALATGDVSYDRYLDTVADSVSSVALAIETLEAADKEREWLANSTFGELDDRRLVDAMVGEANVYMVRGVPQLPLGGPQRKPKYMDLVVDLSASMARFNAFDGRLDRICESLVLLMEAARGLEHKLVFEVHAHSGSAVRLPLLVCPSIYRDDVEAKSEDDPDKNGPVRAPVTTSSGAVQYSELSSTANRVKVISKAVSHSRMAMTGDGTVEGLKLALANAAENVDADETFVVLVSDANLGGYGVSPKEIGDLIEQYRSQKVRCHVVFIAEQHAADWFTKQLPAGTASICTSTSEVPTVLLSIWSEALLDA